jgi:nucleotide-binding universal stress UspA family protein
MEQNAREAYENYIERLKLGLDKDKIHTIFTADDKNKPAYHILEEAEKNLCDLIIMGSKGQSNVAAMFLGSTTEKLLKHDKQVPVLILKNKGENRSLMESLFYAE